MYDLLGVNVKEEDKEEHERREEVLFSTIRKHFGGYGYREIVEAFEMAVMGKLGVEIYQKLDGVLFSRIMTAYDKKINRAELIRQFKPKPVELTTEEHEEKNNTAYEKHFNEFIVHAYRYFFESGDSTPNYGNFNEWYSCDALLHFNMLELTKEKKDHIWKEKTANTAFELEKKRVEYQHMKGNTLEKIRQEDVNALRLKVFKNMCFWEQMKLWKEKKINPDELELLLTFKNQ